MNSTSELIAAHTPIPSTFCSVGNRADLIANSEGSQLPNFYEGFPQCYSLTDATGKKVVREDVNAMIHYCTRNQYYNQCGGLYTFDENVAQAIGGYPLGAILRYIDKSADTSSGKTNPSVWKIRTVRSMKINNSDNFVTNPSFINGTSWKHVDGISGLLPAIYPEVKLAKTFSFNMNPTASTLSGNEFTAPYDCIVYAIGVIYGVPYASGKATIQFCPNGKSSFIDIIVLQYWNREWMKSSCPSCRCFYLAKGDKLRIALSSLVREPTAGEKLKYGFGLTYAPITST